MRRLLLNIVALLFALNGIACACPAVAVAADTPGQHQHGGHGNADVPADAVDAIEDCCESCDEVDASKRKLESGYFTALKKPIAEPQITAIESERLRLSWQFAELHRGPPQTERHKNSKDSPVIRRDRMLD